ncbi:hypothetical protein CPB86DRAFT_736235 [Serendipita vermifera]|nr:hypothetical protein CPB86DRAFT_736235 [Serendipita vermifera]
MSLVHRGSPDYGRADSPGRNEYESHRWHTRGASPSRDDERWSKRKRSTSPLDRHVRPKYNENSSYDRGHHSYGSARRDHSPDRRGSRMEPLEPMKRDTLMSYKQYCDWLKQTNPETTPANEDSAMDDSPQKQESSDSKAKYNEYRRQFVRKQYTFMFEYHKKFAWFIEKYGNEDRYVDMRERVRQQGWKGMVSQFIVKLEGGELDPALPGLKTITSDPEKKEESNDISDLRRGVQTSSGGKPTRKVGEGEFMVAAEQPQLMIRMIPPEFGRLKLEEFLIACPGFKYVAVGDPVQKRHFYRSAWAIFDSDEAVQRASSSLTEQKIEPSLLISPSVEPLISKIRYTPQLASDPDRMEKDLMQAKQLAAVLESRAAEAAVYKPVFPVGTPASVEAPPTEQTSQELEESAGDDVGTDTFKGTQAVEERISKLTSEMMDTDADGNPDQRKKLAISLDMYLSYLRHAFHCCYYCAIVADHGEELIRKCIKHERREGNEEATNQDKQSFERWAELLDSKIACLIDVSGVDPAEYGGTKLDDERAQLIRPHVGKEDEAKWRCTLCKKLFKASEFVEKHILNKHTEVFKTQMEELEMFNNFVLDPQHILPMQTVPPPTEGNVNHPPEAFGLPPNWRPQGDVLRQDRNGREPRDRDRRTNLPRQRWGRRSPSPLLFNKPLRFTMDDDKNGIKLGFQNGPEALPMATALPVIPGLPAKPTMGLPVPTAATTTNSVPLIGRLSAATAPPPPPGQKADPRSRISYQDLDMVENSDDIALQY